MATRFATDSIARIAFEPTLRRWALIARQLRGGSWRLRAPYFLRLCIGSHCFTGSGDDRLPRSLGTLDGWWASQWSVERREKLFPRAVSGAIQDSSLYGGCLTGNFKGEANALSWAPSSPPRKPPNRGTLQPPTLCQHQASSLIGRSLEHP